jgi:toxin YhaV
MSTQWKIFYFKVFDEIYRALVTDVIEVKSKDPVGYKNHPKTKLLRSVRDKIRSDIPNNPADPAFALGKTLGKKYNSWKRVKKRGLPNRYRLFFKYDNADHSIVIAWLNNESCLRKDGSQRDVYRVFLRMLTTRQIPTNWDLLKRGSIDKTVSFSAHS